MIVESHCFVCQNEIKSFEPLTTNIISVLLTIVFPHLEVRGAVEDDDGADELGEGDHGLPPLEPLEGRALLLPPPLIRRHVQVREGHLENSVGDAILVISEI